MTKQILQDPQLMKFLEESKRIVKDSGEKISNIRRDMIRIKKEGKEIDRKIRLLL